MHLLERGLSYYIVTWGLFLDTWVLKFLKKNLFGKTLFLSATLTMMWKRLKQKLLKLIYLSKRWWKQLGQVLQPSEDLICAVVPMVGVYA